MFLKTDVDIPFNGTPSSGVDGSRSPGVREEAAPKSNTNKGTPPEGHVCGIQHRKALDVRADKKSS